MGADKQIDVVTAGLIVGKPTPTGFWASHSICARRRPCGSWLASDSVGMNNDVARSGLIAGKV